MARGWESKSVESQQDEARRGTATGRDLSEEERARLARRRTLELAKARATADLSVAARPAHRALLQQTIQAIDDQLSSL